jgi:acetyltransferase
VRYLGADPASRTLCFFVESLPDGRAFYEAARAVTRTKPVIVAKTGRSAAGVRAARSHTAALAGSERIWRAAVDQAGRILLADEGLDVPELSAGLQDELRALLPPFASPRNPVDMTPVWSRFTELYPLLIERLARSGEIDAIVPVLLQRAAVDERVAIAVRDAVARLRADGVPVPVYVCWVAPRSAVLRMARAHRPRAGSRGPVRPRTRPHRQPTRARRPEPEDRHPAGRAPRARRGR